jgi:hypothetical protein
MLKSLFAAALIATSLAAPAAQALDARAGAPVRPAVAATTATPEAGLQLVGGRHWRDERRRDYRHRDYRYERLSPHQVKRRLFRYGYRDISYPRLRGDVYVIVARGHRGPSERLVVSAYTGEIVGQSYERPRWRPGSRRHW